MMVGAVKVSDESWRLPSDGNRLRYGWMRSVLARLGGRWLTDGKKVLRGGLVVCVCGGWGVGGGAEWGRSWLDAVKR